MATVLPKFDNLTAIVDTNTGKPTVQMQKFMEQFVNAIAASDQSLADAAAQLMAAQGQISAISTVANNASNTASQANGTANPGSPQHQSASGSLHVTSASWVAVASLTFSGAVAATSVTLGSSGPSSAISDYNPKTATNSAGNVRAAMVIAGVDTVLQTHSFTTDSDGNLVFTPFTYSAADAHTGTVGYRLDVEKTGGAAFNGSFFLDVTRTP